MHHRISVCLFGLVLGLGGSAACASGPEFGYVYTAETESAGETELSAWATDRRGKSEGRYAAQDYRLEVEHGITNRFQVSAYVDFASHHIASTNAELRHVDRNFAFKGLTTEFVYQLADPSKGLGVALYAEPGWSRISKVTGDKAHELEVELKAIVQKNLLSGRLVLASNLTLEPEWASEREAVGPDIVHRSEKELSVEVTSGMAYRLSPRWWAGFETRYHSVYPHWTSGLHRENYAVYAGPTVHYDGGEWSITATWLPQLFGSPHKASTALELEDHEKRELRLKLSREF